MVEKPLLDSGQMGRAIQELAEQGIIKATLLKFTAGQAVFEADHPADLLYLTTTGEIRIYHVITPIITRLLDILGPSAWFGLAVLSGPSTYGERAVAMADSVVWAITFDQLRDAVTHCPQLAIQIIQSIALRLNQACSQADQLVSEDCKQRLVQTLLRFSTSPAATQNEEGTVLRMTHAQLAQAVGAARETVSVCLTELRHLKVLRTGRNQLIFKPDALRRWSGSDFHGPGQAPASGIWHAGEKLKGERFFE